MGILQVTLQTLSCFLDYNEDRQAEQPIFPGNVYISCKIFPVCAGWGSRVVVYPCYQAKEGQWELASCWNGHRI